MTNQITENSEVAGVAVKMRFSILQLRTGGRRLVTVGIKDVGVKKVTMPEAAKKE